VDLSSGSLASWRAPCLGPVKMRTINGGADARPRPAPRPSVPGGPGASATEEAPAPGGGVGGAAGPGSHARELVTLAIDIGGTGLKATVLDARGVPTRDRQRIETPRPDTPEAIFGALPGLIATLGPFDRISAGFPGVVLNGVARTAPNLAASWASVDIAQRLASLFKKPARVINDAGVQGLGIIEGRGLEMVLTLGTGPGCGLFHEGIYIPNLELGHHPFRKGKTYEEYLGAKAFERDGLEKWNRHLERAIEQIDPIWNPERIYLGGGNAKHVTLALPPHVQVASNLAGLLGGIALWDGREGLDLAKAARATKTAKPAKPTDPPRS
jgi:polyphosphate glucokinase